MLMIDLLLVALAAKVAWDAASLWRIARRDLEEWQADRLVAWSRESKAPCAKLGHEYTAYGCAWGCDDILVFPGVNTGSGSGFIEHNGKVYAFPVSKDHKFHIIKRRYPNAGWVGLWLFDRAVPRKQWQDVPDAGMSLDHDGVDLYYLEHGKVPPSQQEEAAQRTGTPALNAQPRRAGDAAAQRRRSALSPSDAQRRTQASYPRGQR